MIAALGALFTWQIALAEQVAGEPVEQVSALAEDTGAPPPEPSVDSHGPEAVQSPRPTSFSLLPLVGYVPETRLMLGLVGLTQFRLDGGHRPSNLSLAAIGTQNRQMMVEIIHTVFLPNDSWAFPGQLLLHLFPDSFWGVGPTVRLEDEVRLQFKQVRLEEAALRRIGRSLFIGPSMQAVFSFGLRFEQQDGTPMPKPDLPGVDGSRSMGMGLLARHDRRDSLFTPTRNHMVEVSAMVCPSLLGSTHPHMALGLDARKYFDVRGDTSSVLGLQLRSRHIVGEPSFLELAGLGGREILRGYHQSRFRDKHSVQAQAEWRQHLWWRIGASLFAGIGQVAPRLDELNLGSLKWAAGGGLRFNLNPEEPVSLRIDYGVARDMAGLYVTLGEAF